MYFLYSNRYVDALVNQPQAMRIRILRPPKFSKFSFQPPTRFSKSQLFFEIRMLNTILCSEFVIN